MNRLIDFFTSLTVANLRRDQSKLVRTSNLYTSTHSSLWISGKVFSCLAPVDRLLYKEGTFK